MRDLTKPPQILNTPQRSLAIRNRRIQIILLPPMVDAKPLERQIPSRPIMRLHGPRQKQWTLHPQPLHPILHHTQLHRNDTRNLNRATETNFPVTLAEVQVANAEFCAGNVDGEVDFGAAREVLDVAVSAVFGTAGHGARAFTADFLFEFVRGAASVDVFGLGWESDVPAGVVKGGDELGFPSVPFGENLGRRSAAEDTGVDEAGELDMSRVSLFLCEQGLDPIRHAPGAKGSSHIPELLKYLRKHGWRGKSLTRTRGM